MTDDEDLGKRSAATGDGDEAAAAVAVAAGTEANAAAAGAVGEPIWHDADYIGGEFALLSSDCRQI